MITGRLCRACPVGRRLFSSQGYQGFGSFHSENVDEMVRLPASQYTPPDELPGLSKKALLGMGSAGLPFGTDTKRADFMLDHSWTFVNHGLLTNVSATVRATSSLTERWRCTSD
jgi:hypothetical protein